MPSSARPDLFAFMDAYKVLGVDYTADSAAIRQAHKRLAKQHHPDRFPAGSAEQQQATARMAEINDAYRLIREAPLRYHRVSKASDPTTPWTDNELDDAIRRARMNQEVDRWMTIALIAVAVIAVPFFASSVAVFKALGPLALPLTAAVGLGSTVMLWTMLGPRAWRTLYKIELALLVWQAFRGIL
jgi:hypothetical protein